MTKFVLKCRAIRGETGASNTVLGRLACIGRHGQLIEHRQQLASSERFCMNFRNAGLERQHRKVAPKPVIMITGMWIDRSASALLDRKPSGLRHVDVEQDTTVLERFGRLEKFSNPSIFAARYKPPETTSVGNMRRRQQCDDDSDVAGTLLGSFRVAIPCGICSVETSRGGRNGSRRLCPARHQHAEPDGFAVKKALADRSIHIPVIMMTGSGDLRCWRSGRRCGIHAKPFGRGELLSVLDQLSVAPYAARRPSTVFEAPVRPRIALHFKTNFVIALATLSPGGWRSPIRVATMPRCTPFWTPASR